MFKRNQETPTKKYFLKQIRATLVALAGLGFWISAGLSPGGEGRVVLKYTYRPDQVEVSILRDAQGRRYIPLVEMAKFYGIEVGYDSQTRRVLLTKGKTSLKFALSQPLYLAIEAKESFPMEAAEMVSGQLAVSPDSGADLVSALLSVNVRYLPEPGVFIAGGVSNQEVKQEILAAAQNIKNQSETLPPTPVAEETNPGASRGETPDPGEISPLPPRGEPAPREDQEYHVRRIIIDAGHGGMDGGAKGYDRKYLEKQATLDIAQKVAGILEKNKGLKIFLTRDKDYYVTLKGRTQYANHYKGDLFVSIHCNSNLKSRVSGTEIYVYSLKASSKAARAAAIRENGMMSDMDLTFMDLSHQFYNKRSYKLADNLVHLIHDRLGQHVRRTQQAPFYVLARVDMPSILVETAFISNEGEERKLKDPDWREHMAGAIADGILAYGSQMEGIFANQQAKR